MRIIFHIAAIVVVMLLAGCMAPRPRPPVATPSIRHVFQTNYTLGQPRTAYVGDAMIRAKDYYVQDFGQSSYVSETPLTYHFHPFGPTHVFPAGTPYIWLGNVDVDGRNLRIVAPSNGDARMYPLIVDAAGKFTGLIWPPGGHPFAPGKGKIITLEPATVRLRPIDNAHVVPNQPFHNSEIVYSGIDAESIHLLYREYTPDNLARPAFTQELTYARGTNTIRFRNLLIHVLDADNQQIRFLVESDASTTAK